MATLWRVGMMGAGKSTVGLLVAEHLGRPFVDLDEVVAAAAGASIPDVFRVEGEAGFRRREAAALAGIAGSEAVVACGGGTVVDPGNVALLRRTGIVAWLAAPVAVLAERVGDGMERPLAGAGEAALQALASSREAAYARAAHCRIETGGRSPEEVAEEVMRRWSESR